MIQIDRNFLEQNYLIGTLANQNGIGRFAFTFNKALDRAIKQRNNEKISALISGGANMFIEVYDNKYLTLTERNSLIRLLTHQQLANVRLFQTMKKKITNPISSKEFHSLSEEYLLLIARNDYRNLLPDCFSHIFSVNQLAENKIYIVDRGEKYQVDLVDILESITVTPCLNPRTKNIMTNRDVEFIKKRLNLEIKLYLRYLE